MKRLIIFLLLISNAILLFSNSRELWDLHLQVDVTTVTGFASTGGVETDGEFLYIASSLTNEIAKLDLSGNLIETFLIPGLPFGLEDITTDGDYFYSGSG